MDADSNAASHVVLGASAPAPVPARTLAVLGDSIGFGIGDPVAGGSWRGFAPLLAEAMGPARLVNLAVNGARLGSVRSQQLPLAVRAKPDAAVVFAGMNDTMRSDFDADRMQADLDRVLTDLSGVGAVVVTVRYHDHGRVFRLPGPMRRALTRRIDELNAVVDAVAGQHEAVIVDLDKVPGTYLPGMWSVDRLHPSELGHRNLARAFAAALADAGAPMPGEVSLTCSGGVTPSVLAHVAWLIIKGIPWLFRRGHDLVPYVLGAVLKDLLWPGA